MSILLAADHAGFALKEAIRKNSGRSMRDLTPKLVPGDDYPKAAKKLTSAMKKADRGILICGSGVGMCIAANRKKGIRAMVGHDEAEVRKAREHNDVNVLCLSGWNTPPAKALKLINAFLTTKAATAERHRRRLKQL